MASKVISLPTALVYQFQTPDHKGKGNHANIKLNDSFKMLLLAKVQKDKAYLSLLRSKLTGLAMTGREIGSSFLDGYNSLKKKGK